MANVRVTYDGTVDAAYLYLTEPHPRASVAHTHTCDPDAVDGMINLDLDDQGRLIGIEVLSASTKLPAHLLDAAERLNPDDT